MSNSMHPHWQVDDDEQPVEIRITEKQTDAVEAALPAVQPAKRSYAAFIGIALFAGVGFFYFGGTDLLSGQVVSKPADVTITITDFAVDPAKAQVLPGQVIKWINGSSIPQILSSSTLMDKNNKPFETSGIFPGADYTFELPANATLGLFDYTSQTSTTIAGQIEVVATLGATTPMPTQQIPSSAVPTPVTMPTTITSSSSSAIGAVPPGVPIPAPANAPTNPDTMMNGIAVNPYTVANAGTVVTKGTTTTAAVTTHRPVTQPSSGTGLWIASFCGACALFIVMRKARLQA